MFEIEALKLLLQRAQDQWRGCDWPTSFGPKQLNLCGIRSRQASLAAKATRGDEAACWSDAVAWLNTVERDAADAAELASRAFTEAERCSWTSAKDLVEKAEALEAKYGQMHVYREVRESFQRWFASQSLPT